MTSPKNALAGIILLSVAVAGYIYFRNAQVDSVMHSFDPSTIDTVRKYVSSIQDLPSMVCTGQRAGFSALGTHVSYFHNGMSRQSIRYSPSGIVLNVITDVSGLYVWNEDGEEIVFFDLNFDPNTPIPDSEAIPIISAVEECYVWWWPDERIFRVPADKIMRPYTAAR